MNNEFVIPFLWMHGEDEKRLRDMVRVINESGMNALCVESRPHPDFLGPKWWKDMDVVLDECKKREMGVWILDDEHFPTGYAAGKAMDSEYSVRYITEFHMDIPGPQKGAGILLNLPEPYHNHLRQNRILSVTAGRRIAGANMNHDTYVNLQSDPVDGLVDLTSNIDGDVLFWDVPDGTWRVFVVSVRYGAGSTQHDRYLNPLEEKGTQILLDTVYEAHYQHYKNEFGKVIRGFFSDEPQFGGGYGYHAKLGSFRLLCLPWSDDILPEMELVLHEKADKWLPALWTDVGDITKRVRFAYMDAITRKYSTNFCGKIGDWCRSHGVEYMGHVVEENNAHARVGIGTGHYFRSLWGQDLAGIDIVLSGLIPGLKNASHAQWSELFEADDDFYYYCLAQLAASLSHIDEKKHGRSMCEIFGAYGWQEGLCEMKWLADFMMSRGINHFVPHAFTSADFPDRDCPPHIYAQGGNPQFRYFKYLSNYMNRVCSKISDGHAGAEIAVIYHAEAEWSGKPMTKTQDIIKILTQSQMEADILPLDALENKEAENGRLKVGECSYRAIIVPYSSSLPANGIKNLGRLAREGIMVLFSDRLPDDSSSELIDISGILLECSIVNSDELIDFLNKLGLRTLMTKDPQPNLKTYPYISNKGKICVLFNESINDCIDTTINADWLDSPVLYDPMEQRYVKPVGIGTGYNLHMEPRELVILENNHELMIQPVASLRESDEVTLSKWQVSIATAKEYPLFRRIPEINSPCNLFSPNGLKDFSGTIRYETSFSACPDDMFELHLGKVGETAEVFLNGKRVGLRITPPYDFFICDNVLPGENELVIEVTNTLVYKMKDVFSVYHAIQPSGLIGPVRLMRIDPVNPIKSE